MSEDEEKVLQQPTRRGSIHRCRVEKETGIIGSV